MNDRKPPDENAKPMTGRQAYNLISDTVGGPNVRLRDNLLQGLVILICLALGSGIGYATATDRTLGAMIGGLIGMLVGLLGSGFFLMIYRAVKHANREHD